MKNDIATVINHNNDDEESNKLLENAKNNDIDIKNRMEITKLYDVLDTSEIYWYKTDDL